MNEIPPPVIGQPQPSAPLPPAAPTPPRRRGPSVYSIIATFLLVVSLLANIGLLLFVGVLKAGDPFDGKHYHPYTEEYVQGDTDTKDKIAVIYLTGVISSFEDGATSEEGMVGEIKDQLRQAVEDKHVKAIVIRINSPGGEVVASDEIYQEIAAARKSKPVVASMDTVAASGAFYAAMGADHIVANELTITGSIGVIMESFTFRGLMDKVGVKSYTFKSGKYKDLLNPTREPTPEEMDMVQSMIMEVYDKFVGIVAEERDKKVDDLKNGLADGRILSGKQALDAGFVDELGYFDDAVDAAMDLAKIDKAKVIRYAAPFSLRNLFRIFGKNDHTKIQLQLTPNPIKLEAGKLYFLPPYMFQ